MAIDTMAKLREVYPPPAARTSLRVLDHLDARCREFIALSPFYVICTARADGRADASPRGDPPGSLAYVPDDRTLLLPDRLGNRRADTLTNLVERPYAGLMFFVPGLTDTLRVNGRVEISTDPELLELVALEGELPVSVLKMTVEEAFLHCAKALIRARLWETDARVERSRYATHGQVLAGRKP